MLSDAVDNLHNEACVDNVEFVQSTLEQILQWLSHRLNQLLGYFCQADILEVDYSDPILDLARDQSPRYDELNHVCTHPHQGLGVGLNLFEFLNVHVENGAEAAVAAVHIRVTLVQFLHEHLVLTDLNGESLSEPVVDHHAFVSLFEFELRALEESLY